MADRMPRRSVLWPLLFTLGIVALLGLRVWAAWSQLPETVASHFGVSGRPDAYMAKASFFMIMIVVGGGSVASLFAVPALLHRLPPRLINIPNRDYWLADEERREIAVDHMGSWMGWMAVATAAILAVAVELSVRANLYRTNFDNTTFMVSLGAYFVFVIVMVIRMKRAFRVP